jgi:hypothetical protein
MMCFGFGTQPHFDSAYKDQVSRSGLTMQVYLNDDFEGGQTRFFEGASRYIPP